MAVPHVERYITIKKARSAVRHAIRDFQDTIRAVMPLATLPEKVRFERQIDDLDYIYDDILERMKKSREPELWQPVSAGKEQNGFRATDATDEPLRPDDDKPGETVDPAHA